MNHETTKWEKTFKGPFSKTEATKLMEDLKIKADPKTNGIIEVTIRKRAGRKGTCVCTASCGAGVGHNAKYDVYIKT